MDLERLESRTTGATMKCPKKHVKEDFCCVTTFAFFIEMPKNRT